MKVLRLLAGLIALALIIIGAAVAALLGPDETWGGDPAALPDSAPVIATAPRLLNVAGVELVVRATAADGEVFVGAGHPVHVQDYLGGVTHTEITQLSADGIAASQELTGDEDYPEVAPADLDVWEQHDSAAEVTLGIPLTADAAVQVVALPEASTGPAPRVGIGYAVPGAFVGGISAAIVGSVLLAGTIVWGRR